MANAQPDSPQFSQSRQLKQSKQPRAPKSPIAPKNPLDPLPPLGKGSKMMDLRPSKGLVTGLKRVGGRSGTTRLGTHHPGSAGRTILKKYS